MSPPYALLTQRGDLMEAVRTRQVLLLDQDQFVHVPVRPSQALHHRLQPEPVAVEVNPIIAGLSIRECVPSLLYQLAEPGQPVFPEYFGVGLGGVVERVVPGGHLPIEQSLGEFLRAMPLVQLACPQVVRL